MEFLLIFLVCLVVMLGLILALVFGRTPSYRPTQEDVLELLSQAKSREVDTVRWYLFLGVPITHDERLEALRLECLDIDDKSSAQPEEGFCGYDKASREKFDGLYRHLKIAIEKSPVYEAF